jgi:hypothetical protein
LTTSPPRYLQLIAWFCLALALWPERADAIVCSSGFPVELETSAGTYLTAVYGNASGVPQGSAPLNINATSADGDGQGYGNFTLYPFGGPFGNAAHQFVLQTANGYYVTALPPSAYNNGASPDSNVAPIHTNQTNPGPWEQFWLCPGNNPDFPYQFQLLIANGTQFVTATEGWWIGRRSE